MPDAGFRVRIAAHSVWGVESPLIFPNFPGGFTGYAYRNGHSDNILNTL